MRKGGDCGPGGPMFKGHKHSLETKRKMSENRKGSKNSNYGNRWKQSDELKKKHSQISTGSGNGMYGKHQSKESKEKSRAKHINRIAYSNIELDKVVFIHENQIEEYEKNGWIRGHIHSRNKPL